MEKKFSIFRKNNFEAFGKVPPSYGSLSVYVDEERGEIVNGESVFVLVGVPRAICRVLYGRGFRMGVK